MCTRYIPPEVGDIERHWHVGGRTPLRWTRDMFPSYQGTCIRAAKDSAAYEPELVVGQWNLVAWLAKDRKLKYATSNARSEELSQKASYKHPWARGQRCIVPAAAFFEPNWESGKHVPWHFTRTDGTPWGLAGLWITWPDKATGGIVESCAMLTINADQHALMNRMHRPDAKRLPHMQDKRSVVPIELQDVGQWLSATLEQASQLMRLASVEAFVGEPVAA